MSQLPEEVEPTARPLKISISYAHKDEVFKDELVTMHASMRGAASLMPGRIAGLKQV